MISLHRGNIFLYFIKGNFLPNISNLVKVMAFFPQGIWKKIKTTFYLLHRNLKTQKAPNFPNYSLKMLLNIILNHVSFQGKTSHKFMDETSNPFIRIYYTSRPVLFGMCAGNEIFYASLYLLHFTNGPFYIFNITAVLCFPVAIAKLAIALFQVYNDWLIHLGLN